MNYSIFQINLSISLHKSYTTYQQFNYLLNNVFKYLYFKVLKRKTNIYILLIHYIIFYFRTKFLLHLLVIKVYGEKTIFHKANFFTDYIGKLMYVNSKNNFCCRKRTWW